MNIFDEHFSKILYFLQNVIFSAVLGFVLRKHFVGEFLRKILTLHIIFGQMVKRFHENVLEKIEIQFVLKYIAMVCLRVNI